MAYPSYQIFVLAAADGGVVNLIDQSTPYELRYSRIVNDVGLCALVLPSREYDDSEFEFDDFIEIQRADYTGTLVVEDTYLIQTRQRFRDGNEEKLVISGVSLNQLLQRRVVDPADDPTGAGGYSTKAGAGSIVMRDYALEQISTSCLTAMRQFPNLTVPPVPSQGLNVGRRLRYENLFVIEKDLAEQSGIDFQIIRTSGAAMEMQVAPIGTNKTVTQNYPSVASVLFAPERGNLENPSLTVDYKEYANYVIVQGQGQGADRQELRLAGTDVNPRSLREFVADARTNEKGSITGLQTSAFTELYNRRIQTTFEFETNPMAGGAVYRLDWIVGDFVSVQWRDFSADVRIEGFEVEVSEAGEKFQLQTKVVTV